MTNTTTIQMPMFKGWPSAPGGIPVSDNHRVTSIDEAIAHLGREVGRIGTVLDSTTDPGMMANFLNLYAQTLERYANLLVKQKIIKADGDIAQMITDALDAVNDKYALEL